ncbi:MAG: DUF615 domain-containing protein [Polyangiaceae bacterium]|nr:DUF615 domain-containing protein [Polyangiaceae bacterium]
MSKKVPKKPGPALINPLSVMRKQSGTPAVDHPTEFIHGGQPWDTSRTRQRAEARGKEAALKDLALALIQLSSPRLTRLQLPEELDSAVRVAKTIPPSKAWQRQIKLLARLLAEVDHEAIQRDVADPTRRPKSVSPADRFATEWLARLTAEGDEALMALCAAHPEAPRQELRQALRAHRAGRPAAERSLRQLLAPLAPPQPEDEEADGDAVGDDVNSTD